MRAYQTLAEELERFFTLYEHIASRYFEMKHTLEAHVQGPL